VTNIDSRTSVPVGDKMHIHAGRSFGATPKVPVVGEMAWWIPDGDLAPLMFDPFRGSLVDPAANVALQKDRGTWVRTARMAFGPP
jgi:hypothetical protein